MRSGSAMTSLRSPAPRIAASRVHVEAVRSLLAKAGLDESYLACGAHWPVSEAATRELMRAGRRPQAIHNNCSGKHAGMLAACVHLGLDPRGYERPDHPLQSMIARIISETCGIALDQSRMGIDGCSVPTWALPLGALARGFARLGTGRGTRRDAGARRERLVEACFAAPVLVAGEGRFDTIVMSSSRRQCSSKAAPRACIARRCLGSGSASRSRSMTAPSAGPSARSPR